MTFRDDHDAALARAEALENEVERTKRERDELAAKVKELEEQAKQPRQTPAKKATPTEQRRKERRARERAKAARAPEPSSDSDTRGEKRAVWISVLGTLVLFGVMVLFGVRRSCQHSSDEAAWKAKFEARKSHVNRWNAVTSVEPCVRRIAYASTSARGYTPDQVDPRKVYVSQPAGNTVGNCLGGAGELLADPKTTPAIKAALGAWLDLQKSLEAPVKALDDYYSNRDWQEDNLAGAPALWAPVLRLLDKQRENIEAVRRDVLPALRHEVRDILATHEKDHGRDDLYWRGALTVQLWEINDRSYEAAGIYVGKRPDQAAAATAIRPLVTQFLELAKKAPIDVRRDVRKLDWITSQIVTGGELMGETPLWHLANADHDLIPRGSDRIPALPPEPGPRPVDPD